MKSLVAIVWLAALVGCAKGAADPPGIVPDTMATASSAGAGGSDTTGAGGHGGAAMSGAGAGGAGDGPGSGSVSGSRLKIVSYTSDDGFSMPTMEVRDSVLGFDCMFTPDAAGVIRCFPLQSAGLSYYADSECSSPAVGIRTCVFDKPVGRYVAGVSIEPTSGSCGTGSYKLYEVSATRHAVGYAKTDAGCVSVSYDSYVFAPATEVSTGILARIERVVGGL